MMGTSLFAPVAAAAENTVAESTGSDIVVTATSREQEVKDAPASISVITREDLERLPYREVTDALLEIPGVTVTQGERNSRDISIRGMAPQYTLILVDGKRLSARESRTNGGSISEGGLLPPLESIERIEVVRGPMSSLYGSDAMGGVVNIITRAVASEWRGSVRVNGTLQTDDDFGNYGDGNFYVSGPLIGDVVGLQVSGSLNRRAEDMVIDGTPQREDESLGGKLGFDLGAGHRLIVEGGYYRQQTLSTAGKSVEITEDAPIGTESTMTEERWVASVSHSGKWGAVGSESYLQYEDATHIEGEKQIKNIVGQSIWTVPLRSNVLTLGAFIRNEDLTDLTSNRLSGSTRTGTARLNWALFAENELSVTDNLKLTGGLRMDDDELYGTHWTPRIYAVWNFTERFTLKGGYSQGFRAPNLRQTLEDWGQTSRGGTIYGNPDLEAETSRTVEASLLFESGPVQASLSAYDTRFNDKITRVTCEEAGAWCVDEPLSSLGRPPTTYVNVDKARVRGVEASVELPLLATLDLAVTGTLTDSEQLSGANEGAALNDTPKQQASASLNWKPGKAFSGYVRAIFRGEEAVTEAQISGENIVASSYTTVDLGASYRLTPSLQLHGGVQNVFNKQLTYDEYAYLIDPARVWVGVTARF
ncbi:TonB-dependent receptor domain-containing protein [Croceicoccus sp. Ery15]|uniref:TonB-dependent receptor domain-containing protein n=1 Tax=Croceicoccus sp. Ery15 TaxID=1703338 RepID=UPI001E51D1D6|nr:TonB-dependent receptor [Croceicoccus sp. Ery15]